MIFLFPQVGYVNSLEGNKAPENGWNLEITRLCHPFGTPIFRCQLLEVMKPFLTKGHSFKRWFFTAFFDYMTEEGRKNTFEKNTLTKPSQNPTWRHTVDGKNPANQLRLVVYTIIYKVLYIPGGFSLDFWTINVVSNLCGEGREEKA